MKIDKNFLKRRGQSRKPAPSGAEESVTLPSQDNVRDLPWFQLFRDRGYPAANIPTTQPPKGQSFVKIEEWVTRGGWIHPEDTDLAMDIWLRRVDPFNYVPPAPKPVQTGTPSAPVTEDAGSTSPVPKRRNKFAKRRSASSAKAAPAP